MSGVEAPRKSSDCREIPTRRVLLNDDSPLPNDYSTTPGGTIFSTTPGGTRIIYQRSYLLKCRKSPLAQTPPKLPEIPGVTVPADKSIKEDVENEAPVKQQNGETAKPENADEQQFEMDI